MNHHELKTDPEVFDAVEDGEKTFEIRVNDRDFEVGDRVTLKRTDYSGEEMRAGAPLSYSGCEIDVTITYILLGPVYGLAEGWCVFSFEI